LSSSATATPLERVRKQRPSARHSWKHYISRRALTQPERLQNVYVRTISIECLHAQHFCKCPMLNCSCLCHELDEEFIPEATM
jgi:hypothetical protein